MIGDNHIAVRLTYLHSGAVELGFSSLVVDILVRMRLVVSVDLIVLVEKIGDN